MKNREKLILENIELERTAMKFKRGLHLAKSFINSHRADPDLSEEMIEAYGEYQIFITENGLEDI